MTPTPQRVNRLFDRKMYYATDDALDWSSCEGDSYWNEEGQVEISAKAEKELLEASYELYNLCLEAVDQIVKDDALLTLFTINEALWPAVRESWDKSNTDFMGRFDLAWDGKNPAKLIEFNADTPSLQLESSVLQEGWAKDKYDDFGSMIHQANFMEEAFRGAVTRMFEDCKGVFGTHSLGMVMAPEDEENHILMTFFNEMLGNITHAPVGSTNLFGINELNIVYQEVDGNMKPFWNFKGNQKQYNCLFNNYPKEWMTNEAPADDLTKYDFMQLKSFEPFWKLILGNKALLPFLWQMRPGHPNLLPAYYDNPKVQLGEANFNKLNVKEWVSKPLFGREGMGVFFSKMFGSYDEFVQQTESNYGYEGSGKPLGISIYQAETDLAVAQGRIIQTGSWIVNGMPAGLIFREGKAGSHFTDYDPFLQHIVSQQSMDQLEFRLNQKQYDIRNKLYNGAIARSDIYKKFGGYSTITQTESLISMVDASSHVSVPYTEWRSYQAIQGEVAAKQAQQITLTQADLNVIRSRYKHSDAGFVETGQSAAVVAYFKKYPFNYSGRKYEFGKFSRIDNNGEGQWFSSDRNGIVRVHSYHSGGFGYRIGG